MVSTFSTPLLGIFIQAGQSIIQNISSGWGPVILPDGFSLTYFDSLALKLNALLKHRWYPPNLNCLGSCLGTLTTSECMQLCLPNNVFSAPSVIRMILVTYQSAVLLFILQMMELPVSWGNNPLSTGPHRDHLGSYPSEFSVFPNLTLLPDWTSSLLPGALTVAMFPAPDDIQPEKVLVCSTSPWAHLYLPSFIFSANLSPSLPLDLFYPHTSVPIRITPFLLRG